MSLYDRDIMVSEETEALLREAGYESADIVVSPTDGPLDTVDIGTFREAARESSDRVHEALDAALAQYREPASQEGPSGNVVPGSGTRHLRLQLRR